MSDQISKLFTQHQLQGLRKIGDIMLPAGNGFPSFSECGCIAAVDTAMSSAHKDDIRDFGYLLLACHYAPTPIVKLIINMADNAERFPSFIAPLMRKLNIGIKGIVISLYYSGKQGFSNSANPLNVIDFNLTCNTSDL